MKQSTRTASPTATPAQPRTAPRLATLAELTRVRGGVSMGQPMQSWVKA